MVVGSDSTSATSPSFFCSESREASGHSPPAGRGQDNIMISRKEEHSRKPDDVYQLIERCSRGPFVELFARQRLPGWVQWGDQVNSYEKDRPNHKGYTRNGNRHAATTKEKRGPVENPELWQPSQTGHLLVPSRSV